MKNNEMKKVIKEILQEIEIENTSEKMNKHMQGEYAKARLQIQSKLKVHKNIYGRRAEQYIRTLTMNALGYHYIQRLKDDELIRVASLYSAIGLAICEWAKNETEVINK